MLSKLILSTIFLLLPFIIQGASSSIIINEIAWMGTVSSSSDEWIELYNNSNQDISLEGWGIYEQEKTTLIEPLTGIIKAKSYYLIERTDDQTVPGIEASQDPTGWSGHGLNNKGESLTLLNNNFNLIDEVNCREGWLAGDNKTKQTMERISPLIPGNSISNWQTSQNPGGTPKAKNSSGSPKAAEKDQPLSESAEDKSRPENNPERGTAAAGENKALKSAPLIAFILALFSAVIIFVLKRKLTN